MASSDEHRPNYSRRFMWFAGAIVFVIVAYTAAWYYGAGVVLDQVNAGIATLNRDGRRASCENPEVRGYPFRIGVICRTVMFEDAHAGVGFRARQMRSAAQVYAPRHTMTELDGPATLQVPGLTPLDLSWSSMRASVRLASPLPERISVESKELMVRIDEPGDTAPLLFKADLFELHLRPVERDLDVAVRFAGLGFNAALTTVVLPAFSGVIDVQLADGAVLDQGGPGARNRSGTLRNATVSVEGDTAGATFNGPFSIDDAGLIDAELQMVLRDPAAIAALLAELFPDSRQEIELGLSGVAAMGETPSLPLRIRKGEVRLGFFVLGFIPPV
jgi:hypothetical protein